jgi:hypothetical protein
MKKLYLLPCLLCLHLYSLGQWPFIYTITFDDTSYINQFYFDTLQNPNCKWQIGKPSKTVFSAAYSVPNALLTDTINSLPANDTSVIYFFHDSYWGGPKYFFIEFDYMMHGDSTSYGKLEISPDMGQNWVDIVNDSVFDIQVTCPNNFVGSTNNGWQLFSADMTNWAFDFGTVYPLSLMNADTLLYRFTYISGNANGIYDGWIIDNLFQIDFLESIAENTTNTGLHIYPNPASNQLTIKLNDYIPTLSKFKVAITNMLGQTILSNNYTFFNNEIVIDISQLPNNALYMIMLESNENNILKTKFIKQ